MDVFQEPARDRTGEEQDRKDVNWGTRAQKGFLASGIDPGDRRGHKNGYIDLLQKMALEEVLTLRGDEVVLDFGCGSGRISYWMAPRVKKVVGLEVTPEMIALAEEHRIAPNVEFMLYDGEHFPSLAFPVDLILSIGVLQVMSGAQLEKTIGELSGYLAPGGRMCLIEQASGSPAVSRPRVRDYLDVFDVSSLECLRHYPVRKGRWWLLYLIRYGLVPGGLMTAIASWEVRHRKRGHGSISCYEDHLFLLKKPSG
jgi:SAM-dependent methyltransferase